MSSKHIDYLRREHARLDAEIEREAQKRPPDEVLIARLRKLKLAVKDQIAAWSRDTGGNRAAWPDRGAARRAAPHLKALAIEGCLISQSNALLAS